MIILWLSRKNNIDIKSWGLYEELEIKKPWKGDFNEFMSNSNNRLTFE